MRRQAPRQRPRRPAGGGRGDTDAAVQYTVRNIPPHVDRALRRRAAEERTSLNEVLRQALVREAGVGEAAGQLHTDLDALAGTWHEDRGFDEALRAQDQVDESLWR